MRHLNLDQLLALKTIAATGGFTAAARQLNLSQSAVSVQIRELEARLGLQLLERLGKKAYPTEAGSELISYAERILALSDEAVAALRHRKDGWLGQVRIGASTTAMIYHLPQALAHLRRTHPTLEMQLTGGTTESIVTQLQRNDIDIGVVSLPLDQRNMLVTPLVTEPLVAIFPHGTKRLPKRVTPDSMRVETLLLEAGRAHLKLAIVAWLNQGRRALFKSAMELDNIEVISRMVAAGLGSSIVPKAVAVQRGDVLVRPLDPPLSRQLAMIQVKDKQLSPALRIVREAFTAHAGG